MGRISFCGSPSRPKQRPCDIPTFFKVAPNSIFGASWILVTPNIIFQGIVFDVKKWRKVLARRKLSDSFQSGSNRGDFERTLALI